MYAYIKGEIAQIDPTHAILEQGGIGYDINISLLTYGAIHEGPEAQLFIYNHITDDAHKLYGFATIEEKEIFVHLISVSGIGPNTSRLILSSMNTSEVSNAILNEDSDAFNRIKGIGPKTAKRLIIDLKDKIGRIGSSGTKVMGGPSNTSYDEALSALVALGFRRNQVQKLLEKVRKNSNMIEVEDIVKAALKELS